MKNSFKIGFATLLMATSIVACDPPAAKTTGDPVDSSKKAIDTPAKATIDTAKKDTAKKQ